MTSLQYDPEIEAALRETQQRLGTEDRWSALRVLDGDPDVCRSVAERPDGEEILAIREDLDRRIQDSQGMDLSLALAAGRFAEARRVAAASLPPGSGGRRLGDRFDRLATHRIGGPLILFGVMWLVFVLVTNVSAPFVDWLDALVNDVLGPWTAAGLGAVGLGGGWLEALLVDGVLGGVGGMLAFVPVIAMLYLVLGLLEDSGYFARAAYITDRAMRPIGLPGKSVLPLVVGFGCNVPALMAVRVMERPRDRLVTALLVPFVSCSARLPVFVLLAGALFPGLEGTVVLALYLISIAAVYGVGMLLRHSLMRGTERSHFVLELPPYRCPSVRTVWTQTRQRTGAFLRKAGTIILAASIVVWVLLSLPVRGTGTFGDVDLPDSAFGVAADSISPVFAPAGFGAPELSGALAAGFVAKEIVVTTLFQTVGIDDSDESAASADNTTVGPALRAVFNDASGGHPQAAAAAFMLFVLLYVPCIATVATFGREFGWRWAALSVGLSMVVAWLVAVGAFQLGVLLGTLLGL